MQRKKRKFNLVIYLLMFIAILIPTEAMAESAYVSSGGRISFPAYVTGYSSLNGYDHFDFTGTASTFYASGYDGVYCMNPFMITPNLGTLSIYPTGLSDTDNKKLGAGLDYIRKNYGSGDFGKKAEKYYLWWFLSGKPSYKGTVGYTLKTMNLSDGSNASLDKVYYEAVAYSNSNYTKYTAETYCTDMQSGNKQPLILINYRIALSKLTLKKVSSTPNITNNNNCYSLAGAKYGVYSDSNLSNQVGTLTTDGNGNSNTLDLKPAYYYVKEISPSKGYYLDETVYTVDARNPGETYTVTSTEEPKNDPAGIEITKIWNGTETPTIPSLEGTQFTLNYYDGFYDESNLPSTPIWSWVLEVKKVGNKYKTFYKDGFKIQGADFYRDKNGRPTLPLGTISIQETKPAFGYTLEGILRAANGDELSTTKPYISQIVDESSGVKLKGGNVFSANNAPEDCSIEIKKVSEDGKSPLQGAKFTLTNSKGETVKTEETGDDGIARFDKLYPDEYTVTEVKSKAGYQLLAEPIKISLPSKFTKIELDKAEISIDNAKLNDGDGKYWVKDMKYTVINTKPFKTPETGGKGMLPYTEVGVGIFLLSVAVVTTYIKRKKQK